MWNEIQSWDRLRKGLMELINLLSCSNQNGYLVFYLWFSFVLSYECLNLVVHRESHPLEVTGPNKKLDCFLVSQMFWRNPDQALSLIFRDGDIHLDMGDD